MFKKLSLLIQVAIWIIITIFFIIEWGIMIMPSMFMIGISFVIIFAFEKQINPFVTYLPLLLIIFSFSIVAWIAGFFGPIYFTPEANQSPLFGVLISGPLGAVVGGLIHFILFYSQKKK